MHPCTTIARCAAKSASQMKLFCALLCLAAVIMLVRMSTCPCKTLKTESARIYTSIRENSPSLDRPHNHTTHEPPSLSSSLDIWKNKTVSLHPDVNIVPSTLPETFVLPNQDCVPLPRSPKAGVVVCVYPVAEDVWVSGALKSGRLWEESNVLQFKEYLQRFPDMVFVDIGSNIGEYTLFAAAMGRRTLAVEMLPRNVQHIQTALRISGLGSEVTIVNNALYGDHRVLTVKFAKGNVGGTSLDHSQVGAAKVNDTLYVRTICMDDLVPLLEGALAFIKMDIENSEHQALRGARAFFQKVNVQVVQMEWLNRGKDEGSEILQFMNSSGYVLSKSPNQYTAPDNIHSMSGDVYFLKKSNLGT